MMFYNFQHNFLRMIVNIQKYLCSTYNISLETLKGKKPIKDKDEYNKYNLSIILCWLLLPTQRWGSKSLIARFHGCKHKNRVYRLSKFYQSNSNFKEFVDKELERFNNSN